MDKAEAIAYLTADGDLSVPCSRYGRRSSDCAEVTWRIGQIVQEANGTDITHETLDYDMGLVVNDSDGIAYLFANYGNDAEREEWAEYA